MPDTDIDNGRPLEPGAPSVPSSEEIVYAAGRRPLTRKEAIMMGYNITPMTQEEAILADQAVMTFTLDEQLRAVGYLRNSTVTFSIVNMSADTITVRYQDSEDTDKQVSVASTGEVPVMVSKFHLRSSNSYYTEYDTVTLIVEDNDLEANDEVSVEVSGEANAVSAFCDVDGVAVVSLVGRLGFADATFTYYGKVNS